MILKKKLKPGAKVIWTNSAIEKLEGIFEYYKTGSNLTDAKNIVNRIVDKTILLESHPEIGQIEELLIGRREEYRSLIEGNYKIIYWIDGSYVRIATVFDCRQNPKKIKRF